MLKSINDQQIKSKSCDMSIKSIKITILSKQLKIIIKYIETDTPVQTFYHNIKLVLIYFFIFFFFDETNVGRYLHTVT